MVLGYLWLVEFSVFPYEHLWPAVSATFSGLFFLLPALMTASPLPQTFTLSPRAFDRVLTAILFFGAAIVAIGALSNFRLVGIDEIYSFRESIHFPAPLAYAIGATSMVLLPFAFAGFVMRGARWSAAAALALMLLFYPVTLTKLTLFSPFWLLYLVLLSRVAEIRIAVVLSLAAPIADRRGAGDALQGRDAPLRSGLSVLRRAEFQDDRRPLARDRHLQRFLRHRIPPPISAKSRY